MSHHVKSGRRVIGPSQYTGCPMPGDPEGEKLPSFEISALSEAHISRVLDACADWQELVEYGPPYWRPRSSAELHRKIAATSGPQPASEYSFVISIGARLLGELSLHGIDWRNRYGQVGVCIWSPADRFKGYGRAGVQFLIGWATTQLGLHRLEAWILKENEVSTRLFTSLGFSAEGVLRSRYWCNEWRDVLVLGKFLEG